MSTEKSKQGTSNEKTDQTSSLPELNELPGFDSDVEEKTISECAWQPSKSEFNTLLEMGFSEELARKALYFSKGQQPEAAISWMYENTTEAAPGITLEDILAQKELDSNGVIGKAKTLLSAVSEFQPFTSKTNLLPLKGNEFKMTLVVNQSLGMGVGKISAQTAHAALGVYRKLLVHSEDAKKALNKWSMFGETKIVLKAKTTEDLQNLYKLANEQGFVAYLVRDAGRTQIPSGSITVLGIFGNSQSFASLTGHLKLL